METQLAGLGLVGTRIEAVTPADLSAEEIALYCDGNRPRYLRRKELSCTKSHERVWQTMLDAGQSRALILEDDAVLSPRLTAFLGEIDAFDVDLIRIETAGRKLRAFAPAATTTGGIELRPFSSTPMGAAGYILKADAARRLLGHPAFRSRQTDLALYNPFEAPGASLSRLQTVPGLCQQLGDAPVKTNPARESDIDTTEDPHLFARDYPLRYKWWRFREGMADGLRNAADHFASKKKGLVRLSIPFADA